MFGACREYLFGSLVTVLTPVLLIVQQTAVGVPCIYPTLTYNYQRNYSFKTEQHISILTLGGRVIVPYTGYDKHVALIQKRAEIGAVKLWYDKPKKCFYLLVSLEIEKAYPTPETHKGIIGVDVGVR